MENQTAPTAPSSETTPPQPVPKTAKPSLLIGMTVLVLILLASTGYLAFQNYQLRKEISQLQTSPSPTPTSAASQAPNGDLANWKTYKHDECGSNPGSPRKSFEIKIPQNWREKISAVDAVTTYNYSFNDGFFEIKCGDGFGSTFCPDPDSDEEVVKKIPPVSGREVYAGCLAESKSKNYLRLEIMIYVNPISKLDTIVVKFNSQMPNSKTYEELIDLILSTFKFTQ